MKYSLAFVLFACTAGFASAQNEMQTVATIKLIKTEAITVRQLKSEVENFEKSAGRQLSGPQRREVLDSMINQRLALQAAERDRISVSDSEVTRQMSELRSQLSQSLGRNASDAEFADAVKTQTGVDLATFREQYKKQLTVQKYLIEKKGDAIKKAVKAPTDSEIKSFYEKNRTDFVQPETVEFSAIFFPYRSDSEKSSARKDGEKAVREIGTNANVFDEKVLQGGGQNSSYQSTTGQLMPRNTPAMPDAFINAVFALEQGKVSSLLEVNEGPLRGFYIVKVTSKFSMKNLGIDDRIINVPPEWAAQLGGRRLTVKMFIEAGLTRQKQEEALVKAQEELISDLRKGSTFQVNDQYVNY